MDQPYLFTGWGFIQRFEDLRLTNRSQAHKVNAGRVLNAVIEAINKKLKPVLMGEDSKDSS